MIRSDTGCDWFAMYIMKPRKTAKRIYLIRSVPGVHNEHRISIACQIFCDQLIYESTLQIHAFNAGASVVDGGPTIKH